MEKASKPTENIRKVSYDKSGWKELYFVITNEIYIFWTYDFLRTVRIWITYGLFKNSLNIMVWEYSTTHIQQTVICFLYSFHILVT